MFKPMLAVKADPAKLRFPLYVQPKLDGIRCSIVGGRPLTGRSRTFPTAKSVTRSATLGTLVLTES